MEQAAVTFDDVAVYFTEEEWETLRPEQRSLYKHVISDTYHMILSLNQPDIITNIELGYEPYITSTASPRDFRHTEVSEAFDTTTLQEKSHDTREETSTVSGGQLKRQRRYPRVNPFRWLRKYKKSKSRSSRTAKRSERTQDSLLADYESRTLLGGGTYAACTDTAEVPGGRAGEPLVKSIEGPLDKMEGVIETEQSSPMAEHCPKAGQGDQSTQTDTQYTDTEDKPQLEKPRNVAVCNSSVDEEGVTRMDEEGVTRMDEEGVTRMDEDKLDKTKAVISQAPDAVQTPKTPKHLSDKDRDNQTCNGAEDSPPKATGVLKEVRSPSQPNQGNSVRNAVASPLRKEKHVQFSNTVTTFVFEPQAKESFEEESAGGINLRSKSPQHLSNMNVAPQLSPSLEPKPGQGIPREEKSRAVKGVRSDTVQLKNKKATMADKSEEGSRDAKPPNGVKFKKVRKVESKEEVSPESETTTETPTSPRSLLKATPCSNTEKKDAGTQIDRFSREEKPQPAAALPLPPAYTADQALVKSYSCSNCGKTTHWTRLSDQQKASVADSIPYVCKMCSRQREKFKAAESPGKLHGTPNSPLAKCGKLGKTAGSPDKSGEAQNSAATKCAKSGKASASPDKDSTPTKSGKVGLPGSPSRKKPYCKLPAENLDVGPAAKKQKPDKDVTWEALSKRLKNSPGHNVQTRESAGQTALEPQSSHTEKSSNLCHKCAHSCSPEGPKPVQKLKVVNGTPTTSSATNRVSSPDPKSEQKMNETPTNRISSPDLKKSTPEKNKAIKVVQNGTGDDAEQHPSPVSKCSAIGAPEAAGTGKKQEKCSNCGKHFTMKRKPKPLTSVQPARPAKGVAALSPDKTRKSDAKADLATQSPKEERAKKPEGEGPKIPKPSKVAKSQLCTKCGKRLVLHVMPNEDGPGGGGNENECVVLPRKKRKRPLAGMEPFKCKECGKIFTRHFSLLQHRFIHTGERPYTCKVCGKSFRDSGYLTVHMRSHTNEKPYSCNECGKSFAQHSALVVHQRTHTDERPYQCKDCGKSFTDRSTYRHHQRIHTGEKPYACSFCGKKFTQQPHMKRHESIHTGERPFQCRQCGKRFIDRTKLKKHELIHTRWED